MDGTMVSSCQMEAVATVEEKADLWVTVALILGPA